MFRRDVLRAGKPATVYLLAEAWQGREIAASIGRFFEMTRGQHAETVRVDGRDAAVATAAVSADGKTMTVNTVEKDASGNTTRSTAVYRKR